MRIVIKIGTSLLTSGDRTIDKNRISMFVAEIAALKAEGHGVVLVTSGAIGAGMGKMGIGVRPDSLREKQALAAIGQPILMNAYQAYFNEKNMTLAQVLLTRQDFDDRTRYLNARNTMLSLLDMGAVPVINENDTVAVEEINFGENDTLAAIVAAKISADWLFILTDVDGLYKGIPGKSELISKVDKITSEIEKYALGASKDGKGTGGMKTKIAAAKIAAAAGVRTVILNGKLQGKIAGALKGESAGTVFVPQKALEPRKCWIAFGAKCKGKIIIDAGASAALTGKDKSLLASGIIAVDGSFNVGDTVGIFDEDGKEIARGLSFYSAQDISKIKGKKSSEMKKLLPAADYDEVVHKDNLVIL
jgi:glutamate 5-kinase